MDSSILGYLFDPHTSNIWLVFHIPGIFVTLTAFPFYITLWRLLRRIVYCVYNTAINTELIIFASSGKALDGNIMYSRLDICQA